MIKYVKLGNKNDIVEVLQAQGWSVIGEVTTSDSVYVKLAKFDQELADKLLQNNPPQS